MRKSNWVLLAIVAALVVFVLIWERKQPTTDQVQKAKKELMVHPPEHVTGLTRSGSAPLAVEKVKSEGWTMTSPVKDSANSDGIEGFIDRLTHARVIRRLPSDTPLKAVGLEKPRAVWTLASKSGKTTVEVGAKAALGAGIYVKYKGRIALLPENMEATLLRPVSQFRSQDLLSLQTGEIAAFTHDSKTKTVLEIKHTGERWTILKPVKDWGSGSRIPNMLDDLCFCPVAGFNMNNPSPADLKACGLDNPRDVFVVTTTSGKQITIKLGGPVAGAPVQKGLLYALVSTRPSVLSISVNSIKSLFEEQIRHEAAAQDHLLDAGSESFGEALSYFPDLDGAEIGPQQYLEHIRRCREAVRTSSPKGAGGGGQGTTLFDALSQLVGTSVIPLSQASSLKLGHPYLTLILKGDGFKEVVDVGRSAGGKYFAHPESRQVVLELPQKDWKRVSDAAKVILQRTGHTKGSAAEEAAS
ncbi:MAG: DUF4340 domain-containing protein [Acidobacteriota bacterium]